ncbi:Putative F-box-like domain superfamily protein [Septoria linicola]|uniref:F-box-like domain superfamily protein n=1 Tax=Septoria linicola TaxID=215465 RepID=A0A9Q9AU65_9PEZI|nr:putative F-box-like domain superfamily protein [Septoria linicola]USW55205.1 Putative F-box-like domain superfamily protein [Septoria linicola]
MAAATATLDTGELLELILLNLDTRTLLLSQRVDRRWHYIIRHSKMLQKKLFLLPTNTFDEILELGLLDASKSERYNILDATSHRSKQFLEQVVILNDLLFDTTREWKLRNVAFADPEARQGTDSRVMRFIPSWQRMLLTQPPPSTGKGDVMFWFEDANGNDELCEGVNTLGDMMQKIYVKNSARTDGFDVDWQSASVRPVKHAVDGTYYMKLLAQRKKDEGRRRKVSVDLMKEMTPSTPALPIGESIEQFEAYFDDGEDDAASSARPFNRFEAVTTHEETTWPCDVGAEFANL